MKAFFFSKAALIATMLLCTSWTLNTSTASQDNAVLELPWAKLMPPVILKPANMKSKSFLAGATPLSQTGSEPTPPPPTIDDKQWMSSRSMQPGSNEIPQIVQELDGQKVHIGGYVVPLDFEATTVKEFLLVPYIGACIHVPPPPPNQIIYVKTDKGFDVKSSFDPVYVTGVIKTETAYTGLAETGYTISNAQVEARPD